MRGEPDPAAGSIDEPACQRRVCGDNGQARIRAGWTPMKVTNGPVALRAAGRIIAGIDARRATVRILLAIDGSRSSIQARDLVASLSIPGRSSVTMLTAYDIPVAWFGEPVAAGGARLAEAAEAVRREADATLDRLAAPFIGRDWSVERRVVRGRASGVIVEAAADMAADLIVLGSRGHGPIASMLLGSVSAEVVERAGCSVLVARGASASRLLVATDGSPCAELHSRRAGHLGGIRRAVGDRPQRCARRLGRLRADGAPVHHGQPVARTRPPGIARAPSSGTPR